MSRPPRVRPREWRLREHFAFVVVVSFAVFMFMSVVVSLQPPAVPAALGAALVLPHRHLYARHARRLEWPAALLSTVVRFARAQWPVVLAVLASVDVVLAGLVLVRDGHHLAAMGLLYGSLLAALGWVAWLLAGDR